jgi:hypothetical protein
MTRPRTYAGAVTHARHVRLAHEVGRMGVTITEKKPGDHVWNPVKREWEVVQ